jgi:hypothetical protein
MGNPSLNDPRDETASCWTCKHFEGFNTRVPVPGVVSMSINCTERGRFFQADPDNGCKRWQAEGQGPEPALP